MKTRATRTIFCIGITLWGCCLSCRKAPISEIREAGKPLRIEPDYSGVVIPPNIAPLNFVIQEKASRYLVEITGAKGEPIIVRSTEPAIRIPVSQWRKLLMQNRGQEIRFTVSVRDSQNQWLRFEPIRNGIAEEEIDGYLVYRMIPPIYVLWKKMRIIQRNIGNFDQKTILDNGVLNDGCVNCHSFLNNRSDNWIIHLRRAPATGMLLTSGGKTVMVHTQTEFNKTPAAYPAWHPEGRYIAFATMKVKQFVHMAGENRDVYDLASDLILYDAESGTITSSPLIADKRRLETYPAWTPDGRTLYFCSAAVFDTVAFFERHTYRKILYDVMKVSFDPATGSFSGLETVIASAKTGLSATHPRISPDGRFMLFCQCEYGNFSIYRPGSDLYLMELPSQKVRRLEINSRETESYHSWSKNGSWFVFSSKREDGIHSRPYFARMDKDGSVSKPFVLPQEDPSFYDHCLFTYNIPELIAEPITERPQNLVKAAYRTDRMKKAKYVGAEADSMEETSSIEGAWQPAP